MVRRWGISGDSEQGTQLPPASEFLKWFQWNHSTRRRRRSQFLVKWFQWNRARRRRSQFLVKWFRWNHSTRRRSRSW